LFSPGWQLCCLSAVTLFGQLLLQQFLNSALCPDPLWDVGLSPHLRYQSLCLSQPLLSANGSSGRLACHLAPVLSLCFFTHILFTWEFGSLTHPFSRVGSVFHPHLCCQCWITVCCLFFSVLLGERLVCPGAVLDYVPGGQVEESHVVCYTHLFALQILTSSFETGWQGGFPRVKGSGCHRVQFWLMLCLLLVGRKRKKRETARGLFSQGWTCFVGCAMQDFHIRCN
jgi:hypothetical protein